MYYHTDAANKYHAFIITFSFLSTPSLSLSPALPDLKYARSITPKAACSVGYQCVCVCVRIYAVWKHFWSTRQPMLKKLKWTIKRKKNMNGLWNIAYTLCNIYYYNTICIDLVWVVLMSAFAFILFFIVLTRSVLYVFVILVINNKMSIFITWISEYFLIHVHAIFILYYTLYTKYMNILTITQYCKRVHM